MCQQLLNLCIEGAQLNILHPINTLKLPDNQFGVKVDANILKAEFSGHRQTLEQGSVLGNVIGTAAKILAAAIYLLALFIKNREAGPGFAGISPGRPIGKQGKGSPFVATLKAGDG